MIEKIEPWIRGKRVLFLGYGRERQSTWNIFRRLGTYGVLDITDLKVPVVASENGTVQHTGPDYQRCMDDCDIVFENPGTVLGRPEKEYKCSILSQIGVFLRCPRDQIIRITRTKGESTATILLYRPLKLAGMDTLLVGNIGIPALDHMEEVKLDTWVMFGLFCHQLEYMTISLRIGILVNIHEEYLDRYGAMEKYVEAEHRTFKNQRPGGILIYNMQCLLEEGAYPPRPIRVGMDSSGKELDVVQEQDGTWIHFRGREFRIPTGEIKLLGQHSCFDIGVAHGVCSILRMDDQASARGPKMYEPLLHQSQYIGEREGVKCYGDSISTIYGTIIQVLKTLNDTDTMLVGDVDRGIDYGELIKYLSEREVSHIILMEATGKRVYQEIYKYYPEFKNRAKLILAEYLEDGVKRMRQITRSSISCVPSLVVANYDVFRNFEGRGEIFSHFVFKKQIWIKM